MQTLLSYRMHIECYGVSSGGKLVQWYESTLYTQGKLPWRDKLAYVVTLFVILIIPWIIPTDAGLFFAPASSIYASLVILSILVGWRYKEQKISFADPRWWAIIYAVYTLATNLWAASYSDSVQLTVMEIAALALFAYLQTVDTKIIDGILLAFMVSGIAIYVYGLGAAVSLWQALDAVYDVNKLASIFQYHNTFASFELAVVMIAMIYGMIHRSTIFRIVSMLALYTGIDSIIGSGSRSVIVIAGMSILIALIIRIMMQRSFWSSVTLVFMVLLSLIASTWTTQAIDHQTVVSFVLNVLLGLVLAVVVTLGEQRVETINLTKKQKQFGTMGVLPVLLLALILEKKHVAHAFASVLHRMSTIGLQSISLQERFYYYKDAIPMWLSSPLFGSGGFTWKAKFQAFETMPYWSEQVHSLFFEILLDGGIVGLLLALVMTYFVLRSIVVHYKETTNLSGRLRLVAVVFAALVMLLHSFIDFDFSYGYIMFLFAILVAIAVGNYREDSRTKGQSTTSIKTIKIRQRIGTSITMAAFGIPFILASTYSLAMSVVNSSSNQIGPSANLASLEQATTLAPYDGILLADLADAQWQNGSMNQDASMVQQAWSSAERAAQITPWNSSAQMQIAILAYQMHHPKHALQYGNQALRDAPFSEYVYANLSALQLWTSTALAKTQPQLARQGYEKVIALATSYQNQSKILDMKLFPASVVMHNDPSIDTYQATAELLLGQPQAAQQALQKYNQATTIASAQSLDRADLLFLAQMHGQTRLSEPKVWQAVNTDPVAKNQYNYLSSLIHS